MTKGVEASHKIAEQALRDLKALGLPATPQNIELWCAHLSGENPPLSRDIDKLQSADKPLTQSALDELYKSFIQHADLSRDVIDIVARFRDEVVELQDFIEESGENALGHNKALSDLNIKMQEGGGAPNDVEDILKGVFAIAKSMRTENKNLESRLADSAGEIAALQRNVELVQAEAQKDALTGVANRGEFDRVLKKQITEAKETGDPFALVMADIDHFKQFNDTWGHQTGDQVLRLVAEVMDANLKGQDLLSRYGGEEFAMILPETKIENAEMLANRIREAVESRRLQKRRTGEDLGVITLSMGIARHVEEDDPESMVERADECLYAAKRTGRNRVVAEHELENLQNQKEAG